MRWFFSDSHFGHANILTYDNRPFSSIQEHDKCIINNINDLVKPDDELYCLGDFAFAPIGYMKYLCECILCKNKYFIKGNHDKHSQLKIFNQQGTFLGMYHTIEFTVQSKQIPVILFHYPIEEWDRKFYNSIHLHGHSHKLDSNKLIKNRLNISINLHGFKPLCEKDIINKIEEQNKFING